MVKKVMTAQDAKNIRKVSQALGLRNNRIGVVVNVDPSSVRDRVLRENPNLAPTA